MTARSVGASPQLYARIGGALYLFIIVLGIFGQAFVRDKLIAPGDAAATAANIMSMESLWRCGIATEFLALICTTTLAMIYYVLLRPVSRELNLLATFLRLISIVVQVVAVLFLVIALFPLGAAGTFKGLAPDVRYALVSLAIKSHAYGFGVSLLILGFCFLVHGYLIFRSGFLPRVLGMLIQLAGLCYATHGFAMILAPVLADRIFPFLILPPFIGETSLSLWLLFKGVNVQLWQERNASR